MEDDAHGVHDYVSDPRNADILISVNGELKKRDEAVVSVFDSGYILGDGVWEGLRVMDGGVAFLPEHLKRLWAGAKTLDMDIGLTRDELTARLMDCLNANGMRDGVHIRLMVTRGIKKTPYQGPRFTITTSSQRSSTRSSWSPVPGWRNCCPARTATPSTACTTRASSSWPRISSSRRGARTTA